MKNKKFFEEVNPPKRQTVEPYDQDYVLIEKRTLISNLLLQSYAVQYFCQAIGATDDKAEEKAALEFGTQASQDISKLSPAQVDELIQRMINTTGFMRRIDF